MMGISAVINTYNEAKKLPRALSSLKGFADEIIIVDMMSSDNSREIAKKYKAKIYKHKKLSIVEPARNFGIEKASNNWILILDPDEEVSESLKVFLKKEIRSASGKAPADFYRIPRKNIIFGKWMKHSGWWADMNVRFFKKGAVSWNEVIHSVPMTSGKGMDIPLYEDLAIKHRHYSSVEEYITRMNRYTSVQAKDLNKKNVEFKWRQLLIKPASEFLRRYFAEEGYKDGLHGLTLSLLQALSELVLYVKLWQKQKFKIKKIEVESVSGELKKISNDFVWWVFESKIRSAKNIFSKLWLKLIRKLKYQ